MKLRFALLIFITISFTRQQFVQISQIQQVDAYLKEEAASHAFRGAVLVGKDGQIAFERGYGFADEEWNANNTPTTKFRIGSLTKQFTAACILVLQERGKVRVTDLVSKYLPDIPDGWKVITLHELLTHTSGLPDYTNSPEFGKLSRTGATPQQLFALVEKQSLEFKPGTQLSYSNTGYLLLGMVIEKISGQSYAQFLKEAIFEPLRMDNSGYDRTTDVLKERASGYDIKDGRIQNAEFLDMSIPYAAGGIYSTVGDLFLWNDALSHSGKLLSADSLRQMFSIYPETTSHDGQNYGYGVVITHRFGKLLYYHGGGLNGFATSLQRYPQENVCIIVLSNLESQKSWDIGDHIASILFELPLPSSK